MPVGTRAPGDSAASPRPGGPPCRLPIHRFAGTCRAARRLSSDASALQVDAICDNAGSKLRPGQGEAGCTSSGPATSRLARSAADHEKR